MEGVPVALRTRDTSPYTSKCFHRSTPSRRRRLALDSLNNSMSNKEPEFQCEEIRCEEFRWTQTNARSIEDDGLTLINYNQQFTDKNRDLS